MRTTRLAPDEHDRLLAVTSHLPHVVAAALASLLGDIERPFAATGFRDTTRVAGGEPSLWTPILLGNAEHILESLGAYEERLTELREALESRNGAAVTAWLSEARRRRAEL